MSGNLNDLFANAQPIQLEELCERCGKRPPTGSIGSLIDSHWTQHVCSECYKEMDFKPLSDIISVEALNKIWDTPEK